MGKTDKSLRKEKIMGYNFRRALAVLLANSAGTTCALNLLTYMKIVWIPHLSCLSSKEKYN